MALFTSCIFRLFAQCRGGDGNLKSYRRTSISSSSTPHLYSRLKFDDKANWIEQGQRTVVLTLLGRTVFVIGYCWELSFQWLRHDSNSWLPSSVSLKVFLHARKESIFHIWINCNHRSTVHSWIRWKNRSCKSKASWVVFLMGKKSFLESFLHQSIIIIKIINISTSPTFNMSSSTEMESGGSTTTLWPGD